MTFGKNLCVIFLACAVLIAGAIFIRSSHKRLQAAEKEYARLAAQIPPLKTRLHDAESDLEQVKAEWKGGQSTAANSAVSSAELARLNAMWEAYMERVKTDPKFQKNYYEGKELDLNRFYGVFFAKQHLTPDQTDKLKKALVQREMDKDDLKYALQAQGFSANDPSGLPIKQQSDDAFQQSVEDIIGPDGYARFETYDGQAGIRQMMSRYAAESALIGSPMTSSQVDQMVDYITQNNPDYQNGKPINTRQIDWSAVDEQARKIMTPEQYDLFTHANPMGGAVSRWMQKVNLALDDIVNASKQNADAAPAQ